MPISSGFGYYPYHYPTTITGRVSQSQPITHFPQVKQVVFLLSLYSITALLCIVQNN